MNRTEFGEQPKAILDASWVWWLQKRKLSDVAKPDGGSLQNHRGKVGAQNLWVGEIWAALEIFFRIEAKHNARTGAAGATRTLIGAGFRDCLNRQTLHLGFGAVARNSGGAGINHIFDVGNREAGFGNVGGQNHPAAQTNGLARLKHQVLLGSAESTIEWQNFGALIEGSAGDAALDSFLRIANLGLTRQEN